MSRLTLHDELRRHGQQVLVLQGGGALGAYQVGVYQALHEAGVEPDWVIGTSIGAINAAIIAGSRAGERMDRLREFWRRMEHGHAFDWALPTQISAMFRNWSTVVGGLPAFFTPNLGAFASAQSTLGAEGAGYYSVDPLRKTLADLIDFDQVNGGPVRLTVGASRVTTSEMHYFDSRDTPLDLRHIMASGALPPGLPPIEIDGRLWWDGGLVSNTPLTHVLDNQTEPLLAFQVDLFAAATECPKTIMDVMAREKEIRFSSRTRQISDQVMKLRQEREAIRKVIAKLPLELQGDADVRALAARAAEQPVNLVHLIYRANAWEGGSRDFEFSARTMREHWAAGRVAVDETMANAELVAQNIETGKSASFDLALRPQPQITKE